MKNDNNIILPQPCKEGGMPLLDALAKRRSGRKYDNRDIDLQTLSNLLWAAFGINSERGGRTAPSSHNSQEIELYIFLRSGVYKYNASENILEALFSEDLRAMTATQPFAQSAPLNIAFVGDKSRLQGKTPQEAVEIIFVDSGFISQNIYLFCTSFNLRNVVRLMFDRKTLTEKLGLSDSQEITLIQSVGYPIE